MLGIRTEVAILVYHLHGDEREVASVGFDCLTIGHQFDVMRGTGCTDFLFGYGFTLVIISHYLHGTRFVLGIHPHEAIALLALEVSHGSRVGTVFNGYTQVLGTLALALAVDEEFGTRIVGIDKHRSDFAFATFPIPVRQDV